MMWLKSINNICCHISL